MIKWYDLSKYSLELKIRSEEEDVLFIRPFQDQGPAHMERGDFMMKDPSVISWLTTRGFENSEDGFYQIDYKEFTSSSTPDELMQYFNHAKLVDANISDIIDVEIRKTELKTETAPLPPKSLNEENDNESRNAASRIIQDSERDHSGSLQRISDSEDMDDGNIKGRDSRKTSTDRGDSDVILRNEHETMDPRSETLSENEPREISETDQFGKDDVDIGRGTEDNDSVVPRTDGEDRNLEVEKTLSLDDIMVDIVDRSLDSSVVSLYNFVNQQITKETLIPNSVILTINNSFPAVNDNEISMYEIIERVISDNEISDEEIGDRSIVVDAAKEFNLILSMTAQSIKNAVSAGDITSDHVVSLAKRLIGKYAGMINASTAITVDIDQRGKVTYFDQTPVPVSIDQYLDGVNAYSSFQSRLKKDAGNVAPTVDEINSMASMPALGTYTSTEIDQITRELHSHNGLSNSQKELLNHASHGVVINTQYYTPAPLVEAMWKTIEGSGFTHGRIGDLAFGNGGLFAKAPKSARSIIEHEDTEIIGVEIDPIMAGISRALHPGIDIRANALEKEDLELEPKFDVIISNIPFGSMSISDKRYTSKRRIHNYFMTRANELLKPGGLMVIVAGASFMDSPRNQVFREMVAETSQLITAARMSNSMFKDQNADVGTDILVFRKYMPKEKRDLDAVWVKTKEIEVPVGRLKEQQELIDQAMLTGDTTGIVFEKVHVNQFYTDNKENVMGHLELGNNQFFGSVKARNVSNLSDSEWLNLWVKHSSDEISKINIHADIASLPSIKFNLSKEVEFKKIPEKLVYGSLQTYQEGSELLVGRVEKIKQDIVDETWIVSYSELELSEAKRNQYVSYIKLRDAAHHVIETQVKDSGETKQVIDAREKLNSAYDEFFSQFGSISSDGNKKMLSEDVYGLWSLSLEKASSFGSVEKAGIFNTRIISSVKPIVKVSSLDEALAVSLSESGEIELPRIAALVSMDIEIVKSELKDKIYENPVTGKYELAEIYLSGDVLTKISQVEKVLESRPELSINLDALKNIKPESVPLSDISVMMGSAYIDGDIYSEFLSEYFSINRANLIVRKSEHKREWKVSLPGGAIDRQKIERVIGSTVERPKTFLEDILNRKQRSFKSNFNDEGGSQEEHQATQIAMVKIRSDFKSWVYSNAEIGEEVERKYNETQNRWVQRKYDTGKILTYPGMSKDIELYDSQNKIIWRSVTEGNIVNADEVGGGKTFTQIATAMKQKEWGISKKSLIVVFNPTTLKFASEAIRLFPNIKLKVITTTDMKAGSNAVRTMIDVVMNDYDLIITPHSTFSHHFRLSDPLSKKYINKETRRLNLELERINDNPNKVSKTGAKAIKRLIATKISSLEKAVGSGRPDAVTLDAMGIDSLFLDEAHAFTKGLGTISSLPDIRGVSSRASQRSLLAHQMCTYLADDVHFSRKGVMLSTGTPLSNSVVEMYNIFRMLRPEAMEERGIYSFDEFLSVYAETDVTYEKDVSGAIKEYLKLKFVNLPELQLLFHSVVSVGRIDENSQIVRPDLIKHVKKVPQTEVQEAFKWEIISRASILADGNYNPEVDNHLMLANDAKMASIDTRLLDPRLPGDNKLKETISEAYRIYHETDDRNGVQLVFLDSGVHGGAKIDLYQIMRDELISLGIPENEIVFAQENKATGERRYEVDREMHSDVRAGKTRFFFGSTTKMGIGVEVQNKVVHMHHVDTTWKGDDVEQRDGRGARQGNENTEVGSSYYVTENSFDEYVLTLQKTKESLIKLLMSGKITDREFEEEVTITAQEILMASTGSTVERDLFEKEKSLRVMKAHRDLATRTVAKAVEDLKNISSRRKENHPLARKNLLEYAYSQTKKWHEERGLTLIQKSNNTLREGQSDLFTISEEPIESDVDTSRSLTKHEEKIARGLYATFINNDDINLNTFNEKVRGSISSTVDLYVIEANNKKKDSVDRTMINENAILERMATFYSRDIKPYSFDGKTYLAGDIHEVLSSALSTGISEVEFTYKGIRIAQSHEGIAGSQTGYKVKTRLSRPPENLSEYSLASSVNFVLDHSISHSLSPTKIAESISTLDKLDQSDLQKIKDNERIIDETEKTGSEAVAKLTAEVGKLSILAQKERKERLDNYHGPKSINEWISLNPEKCNFLSESHVKSFEHDCIKNASHVLLKKLVKNNMPIKHSYTDDEKRGIACEFVDTILSHYKKISKSLYHPQEKEVLADLIENGDDAINLASRTISAYFDFKDDKRELNLSKVKLTYGFDSDRMSPLVLDEKVKKEDSQEINLQSQIAL